MAAFDEEIYETNSIIEEKCSLIDEGYWYENDLLLAAELGKTLLERNRDLETQLSAQTKNSHNLRMEIDLLKKQLETLRELNRNKMILYEDVDKNSHDLEIINRNLTKENKKQKERIFNITKKNSYLEQNLDDLNDKLKSTEKEIEELKKLVTIEHSNNSYNEELNKSILLSNHEHSINTQRTHSATCKKCKDQKERITVLEIEIELKNQENEELRLQISDLQKKLRHIEVELDDLKCFPQQNMKNSPKKNALVEEFYSVMEYDIDRIDEKPIEVGSLNSGCQVFASTNSMRSIGAETTKINEPSSLLKELDEKYNHLVTQYEDLLQSSRSREETSCNKCSSLSYNDDEFRKKLNNIFSEETRRQRKLLTTQNYRPKYKELFRDAFNILKDMKQTKRSLATSVSSNENSNIKMEELNNNISK